MVHMSFIAVAVEAVVGLVVVVVMVVVMVVVVILVGAVVVVVVVVVVVAVMVRVVVAGGRSGKEVGSYCSGKYHRTAEYQARNNWLGSLPIVSYHITPHRRLQRPNSEGRRKGWDIGDNTRPAPMQLLPYIGVGIPRLETMFTHVAQQLYTRSYTDHGTLAGVARYQRHILCGKQIFYIMPSSSTR